MNRLRDFLCAILLFVIINMVFLLSAATGRDIQVNGRTCTINTNSSAYRSDALIVKFKFDFRPDSAKTRFRSGQSIGELNKTFGLEYMKPLFEPVKTNIRNKVNSSFFSDEIYLLRFNKNTPMKELLDAYNKLPEVEFAEPDYIVKSNNISLPMSDKSPNDPYYYKLWGLNNIKAPDAWKLTTGSEDVVVAVIDSGVDYTHPDLAANIWINENEIPDNGLDDDENGLIDDYYGYDFCNKHGDPMDEHGHGTHCSGTIAAAGNDNQGIPGTNWEARVMPLKFMGYISSDGRCWGYTSDGIEAIKYAIMMNAEIINASWASDAFSYSLKEIIEEAKEHGILFVASAGNDTEDTDLSPIYPACYDISNIISVAAIDSQDSLAYFSNYGLTSVDLGAPGAYIYSTIPGGMYEYWDGTSMAAPHVAGVAALIKSLYPEISLRELKTRILENTVKTDSLKGKTVTGGRLDAFASLEYDDIPPDKIQDLDLELRQDSNSIVLTWTSPGDDDHMGIASYYDIRYSVEPLSKENFALANEILCPFTPKQNGEKEEMDINYLIRELLDNQESQHIEIAIKSVDNVGNVSEISNVLEINRVVKILFEDDMETESTQLTGNSLWHLENYRSHSGSRSWAYNYSMDGNNINYDLGANSGSLYTMPIYLEKTSDLENIYLGWWHWSETESSNNFDLQHVYIILDDTDEILVWQSDSGQENIQPWRKETIAISEFAGHNITVKFYFDTIDGVENDYEGWYIDDIQISIQSIGLTPVCILDIPDGELSEGETYTFSASNSYDPLGYPLTYTWDFGDGNISYNATSHYKFLSDQDYKEYTVTLYVMNYYGLMSSKSANVKIKNMSPKAEFRYEKEGKTLRFFDQSTSYNEISSWHWDFGNGSVADEQDTKHTYDSSGTYTVILKITDEDGDISKFSREIEIEGDSVEPIPSLPYESFLPLPGVPWLSNTFGPIPFISQNIFPYNLPFNPIGYIHNPFLIQSPVFWSPLFKQSSQIIKGYPFNPFINKSSGVMWPLGHNGLIYMIF